MKPVGTVVGVFAAFSLLPFTAFAQSEMGSRTAVSFVGGANSRSGIALGGSWLFDIDDRTSVEAQGTYLDRGTGSSAVSLNGSILFNLIPGRARLVPYAALGGGLYRASFDLGNTAFFGPIGTRFGPGDVVCPSPGTGYGPGPGAGFGPGIGMCSAIAAGYWGVGHMPDFYARRLGSMVVPAGGRWDARSFTDPALSVGGGLRFNVNDHVMIRPDVRALVVFADRRTHTLGVFGVQFGYRF